MKLYLFLIEKFISEFKLPFGISNFYYSIINEMFVRLSVDDNGLDFKHIPTCNIIILFKNIELKND